MTYRFLIVVEDAGKNFSAYSPDLPGCVATGRTRDETEQNMRGAIQLHIEGLKRTAFRFRPLPRSPNTSSLVIKTVDG